MEGMLYLLLGFIAGVLLGGLGVLLWSHRRAAAAHDGQAALKARIDLLEADAASRTAERDQLRADLGTTNERREAAERDLATLKEQLRSREQQFEEQRTLLAEAEVKLKDTFRAVGSEALAANQKQFLELAQQAFGKLMTEAKGDVEKRQQAIDHLVKPIRELLEKQSTHLQQLEKARAADKSGLEEQFRQIAASHEKLGQETGRLVSALRRPEQRGRWGEMQLRNVVELAGMTKYCDFEEQATQRSGDGQQQRPDMVVRLPGGGSIVVDAKVALDAYLNAIQPDADRATELQRHVRQVEQHIKTLAQKKYWDQFERAPNLVVMFMPLESALLAALEEKPDLHADAMHQQVLLATPTLLVALLRAVAYGWRQEDVAANAREIARAGDELYSRLSTFADHFEKVGRGLRTAGGSYNAAIGSLERNLLPGARKLRELHATTKDEVTSPEPIDFEPRPVTAVELTHSEASRARSIGPDSVGAMDEADD